MLVPSLFPRVYSLLGMAGRRHALKAVAAENCFYVFGGGRVCSQSLPVPPSAIPSLCACPYTTARSVLIACLVDGSMVKGTSREPSMISTVSPSIQTRGQGSHPSEMPSQTLEHTTLSLRSRHTPFCCTAGHAAPPVATAGGTPGYLTPSKSSGQSSTPQPLRSTVIGRIWFSTSTTVHCISSVESHISHICITTRWTSWCFLAMSRPRCWRRRSV